MPRDVAAKLRGAAASVRILELPALLPKQDVSNWLDAGYTTAQLEELLQAEPVAAKAKQPDAAARAGVGGARLLDDLLAFLGRFISYPSVEASRAHVLWVAHTHLMDAWESTPRIAFLSPEPASGKTRALEVSELLVPRPVEAVNVSPAYLFRKVADDDGAPTILFDEIDTIFGPKAKDNEEIRGLLNAGHRRGAVTGRCVVHGRIVSTEEIPAYCAVALAGLGWLPETLMTRAVVVRMRPRAPAEQIEPYRRRQHAADGMALHNRLEKWAAKTLSVVSGAWPEMPVGIEDRAADVWEPLLAVADAAAGDWPRLARAAAVALVAEARDSTPSLGIRLLGDLRAVFADREAMATRDILAALIALAEAPWGDLKGKPLSDRGLAHRLRQYGIKSITVRVGYDTPKGYRRTDFVDAWSRYLAPGSATSATSATDQAEATATANPGVADDVAAGALVADGISPADTPEPRVSAIVADVADVADFPPSQPAAICVHCCEPIQPGEETIERDDGRLIHRHCFAASFRSRR